VQQASCISKQTTGTCSAQSLPGWHATKLTFNMNAMHMPITRNLGTQNPYCTSSSCLLGVRLFCVDGAHRVQAMVTLCTVTT
jgi:hypothetical protein